MLHLFVSGTRTLAATRQKKIDAVSHLSMSKITTLILCNFTFIIWSAVTHSILLRVGFPSVERVDLPWVDVHYPLWFGWALWITVCTAGLFQLSFCLSGFYPVDPFVFQFWIWPVYANQSKIWVWVLLWYTAMICVLYALVCAISFLYISNFLKSNGNVSWDPSLKHM